jgi:hypothetical protein
VAGVDFVETRRIIASLDKVDLQFLDIVACSVPFTRNEDYQFHSNRVVAALSQAQRNLYYKFTDMSHLLMRTNGCVLEVDLTPRLTDARSRCFAGLQGD